MEILRSTNYRPTIDQINETLVDSNLDCVVVCGHNDHKKSLGAVLVLNARDDELLYKPVAVSI